MAGKCLKAASLYLYFFLKTKCHTWLTGTEYVGCVQRFNAHLWHFTALSTVEILWYSTSEFTNNKYLCIGPKNNWRVFIIFQAINQKRKCVQCSANIYTKEIKLALASWASWYRVALRSYQICNNLSWKYGMLQSTKEGIQLSTYIAISQDC